MINLTPDELIRFGMAVNILHAGIKAHAMNEYQDVTKAQMEALKTVCAMIGKQHGHQFTVMIDEGKGGT